MIDVQHLDVARSAAYEAFVRAHPAGLLYYSLAYRRLLEAVVPGRARYYLALRGGQVCGVLPLFVVDGPMGTVVNSLPYYGSHGGPLAADAEAAAALAAAYTREVDAAGVAAATLVENPLAAIPVPVPHDVVDERTGQFTPLPAGEADPAEALMASFHYKTRNMIRKAEKLGVRVRRDDTAFGYLQAVHEANMQALGGRAKRAAFFEAVPACFEAGVDYRIFVAERDGVPAAALLLFYFNDIVEYFTPAVDVAHRSAQPLSLLIHHAMADAATRGYRRWNWGGTWPSQDSLYRFKKRWGTSDLPYRYRVTIRNPALRHAAPADLLAAYPDYFVLPFHLLESSTTPSPS